MYVLQQAPDGGSEGSLYVGESDSIARRLKEHRATTAKEGGRVESLACVLVEVASKSEALALEELAIRRLKERRVGYVRNVAKA